MSYEKSGDGATGESANVGVGNSLLALKYTIKRRKPYPEGNMGHFSFRTGPLAHNFSLGSLWVVPRDMLFLVIGGSTLHTDGDLLEEWCTVFSRSL